ncbi:MAG: Translation initiation factor IF-3 [candidate division TM6 bacterium GW2011_GWE2_42_60]|nr:MAG: Translation initiation factor IF-3 [candidate division TM6 bacterium GW2011_GWE2_42_60]HBY06153.1 translation initiation factor IF-3 [Candidatus Dependentiae bacterium]
MIGRQKKDVPLSNEKIKFDKVQLITENGENRGVISRRDALTAAQEARLDLVIISEQGAEGVPVAKLVDLGKLQYERKKQTTEAKKKQHVVQVKELKFRPKIAEHDLLTKANQAVRFLLEGKHVKVTLVFRGREAAMREEQGGLLFERFLKALSAADFGGKTVAVESESKADSLWSRIYLLKK